MSKNTNGGKTEAVVSKNTNELKLGAPPTFSASLTQTPTMQELASVRRFLDGLCSGNNGSNLMIAPRQNGRISALVHNSGQL